MSAVEIEQAIPDLAEQQRRAIIHQAHGCLVVLRPGFIDAYVDRGLA